MGMARTLLAAAKGAINRGLAPLGFSLDRISRPVLSTVDPSIRDTVARVGGFTGDIVECGVWRGGSMMAAAFTLMQLDARRHLHLFDTFAGMPAASDDKDIQIEDGIPANVLRTTVIQETGAWAYASEDDVRRNMASTGYETSFIHLHKGMVEETLPREAPAQIAILRLDTDWYDSTRHELEHLWPGLSIGGVLIIDDYGHFSGAQLATDEFFSDKNALLFRIDYAARMIIKQI
jgi:O-methyltransferase